jgi:hypothetical protein
MMQSVSQLVDSKITATDGEVGHVRDVYFDDIRWTIRYLVVDAGTWLTGRDVLISPYSVTHEAREGHIPVRLTRDQVKNSPPIDTHQPVSRQHERQYMDYYAYPAYWAGSDLWAMGGLPVLPPPLPTAVETQAEIEVREQGMPEEDFHLRSCNDVKGHDIQAMDESIGHVSDFLYDPASWAIRYLVVDTSGWWPGGRKVLLATPWIDRIDWADRTVFTGLTREEVKNSPEYVEAAPLDRAYEESLHAAYKRPAYWTANSDG